MIAAFGPIWILTALGYAIRRTGLLDGSAAVVLSRFVFHLTMPAALYLTLARIPLSSFDGRSLAAFAASTVVVLGAGWLLAGRCHHEAGERTIWTMAAGYVNSANLGIPIAMRVLGSVSFLIEVVLVQSLLITPVILMALDRAADPHRRLRLRRLASMPLRNPVILGSLAGMVASATGFRAPGVVTASLSALAAAAVPAALVALGASLYGDRSRDGDRAPHGDRTPDAERARDGDRGPDEKRVPGGDRPPDGARGPNRCRYRELGLITAVKLAGQPLVAFAAGSVLHLSRPTLLAVVVCAGLPTAQNTFIFATEYGVARALSSRAVIATTAFSLVTLAAITAVLK